MTKIDEKKLRAMSVHDRHQVWVNARKKDTPEAKAIVETIEGLGLPFSEVGGLRMDDPIVQKMYQIIFSAEGKAAGLESTKKGMPALTGIDPLLFSALGVDYGSHNDATLTAGYLVA